MDKCTGCGLCETQCPKKSISMRVGFMGHMYPVTDLSTCIDCGLCKRLCPSINSIETCPPITAYAAWAKNEEEYVTSTSGGAASVLSRHILNHGGVVYGCSVSNIDSKTIDVKHIRVDNEKDLYRLKGSKYVQSRITDIIPQLKSDVRNGLKVLFIGTPCQVAAIRNIYEKKGQPDNLYLVDLICHGVPSLQMLQSHIKSIIGDSDIDNVRFRDGNGMYLLLLLLQNKILYKCSLQKERYKDLYFNAFFDGFTYRDSCYTCGYARPERVSDLTIGDFWKLGKSISADYMLPHTNGCSVILPSTLKGEMLVKEIASEMNIYERPVQEAVDGNEQLRHPYHLDWRRLLFRKFEPYLGLVLYRYLNLDKIIKYNIKKALMHK